MLEFQPRVDGLRVVDRDPQGLERMLASVRTKSATGADAQGVTVYTPLPIDECTIHSAIGPLPVAVCLAIIDHLKGGDTYPAS